jgi:hypothetical protein
MNNLTPKETQLIKTHFQQSKEKQKKISHELILPQLLILMTLCNLAKSL